MKIAEMEYWGLFDTFKSFFDESKSVDICTFGILKEAWGYGVAKQLL